MQVVHENIQNKTGGAAKNKDNWPVRKEINDNGMRKIVRGVKNRLSF